MKMEQLERLFNNFFRQKMLKPRPESGLDCLMCGELDRQRGESFKEGSYLRLKNFCITHLDAGEKSRRRGGRDQFSHLGDHLSLGHEVQRQPARACVSVSESEIASVSVSVSESENVSES